MNILKEETKNRIKQGGKSLCPQSVGGHFPLENKEAYIMAFHFTDENFNQEALSSNIPVLVDFYADWCGPCKMLAPVIETLATEYEGKVKIGKLNVDNAPDTAQKYGVMSIPTLLYIKNGEVVNKTIGVVAKSEIEQVLNSL